MESVKLNLRNFFNTKLSPLSKHSILAGGSIFVFHLVYLILAITRGHIIYVSRRNSYIVYCAIAAEMLSLLLMMVGIVKRKMFFMIPAILGTIAIALFGFFYWVDTYGLTFSQITSMMHYQTEYFSNYCLIYVGGLFVVINPTIAVFTEIFRETSSKRKQQNINAV